MLAVLSKAVYGNQVTVSHEASVKAAHPLLLSFLEIKLLL